MILKIEHGGHPLELLPSGAILWESTLFVADLHLGKETVFQKAGVAIPSGATQATLQRLLGLIDQHRVERLVVLGDLFHAPTGWTPELAEALTEGVRKYPGTQWELVVGNHDRRSHGRLTELGWLVHPSTVVENRMQWLHDPMELASDHGLTTPSASNNVTTSLAGHLHPSFKVPIEIKRSIRTRCFWIQPKLIVLPAFGGWVGTHPIEPQRCDRVILCVENELIEWKVDHDLRRSSD